MCNDSMVAMGFVSKTNGHGGIIVQNQICSLTDVAVKVIVGVQNLCWSVPTPTKSDGRCE